MAEPRAARTRIREPFTSTSGHDAIRAEVLRRLNAIPAYRRLFGQVCGGEGRTAPVAGPAANEDFGLEDITGDPADRFKFRTSPLRNLACSRRFMHNAPFTSLEAAIRHHLDVFASARAYDAAAQGLDADLTAATATVEAVLAAVDPWLVAPIRLTAQFHDLVAFVRFGLLDRRALPENLRKLVPKKVPSGRAPLTFLPGG